MTGPQLAEGLKIPDRGFQTTEPSPSGIWNPPALWNPHPWNLESPPLESGIRPLSGIWNLPLGIWNPNLWNLESPSLESGIPTSGIWNPHLWNLESPPLESGIPTIPGIWNPHPWNLESAPPLESEIRPLLKFFKISTHAPNRSHALRFSPPLSPPDERPRPELDLFLPRAYAENTVATPSISRRSPST